MLPRDVKNTILGLTADLLAPHYCCYCGDIGAPICPYCKFDIISEAFGSCIKCRVPVAGNHSLCQDCRVPYSEAWCVGERQGALKAMIDCFKFGRTQAAGRQLAEILDATLPILPPGTLVVPVPTIAPHIRQRGYAHVELIARILAEKRGLLYRPELLRRTNATQKHLSRQERYQSARQAFRSRPLDYERCLLIDDVFTTGATVEFATRGLLEAGASEVWLAILSRQPLEK